MCEVCVAENALSVAACGRGSCPAWTVGHEIMWRDAPAPAVPPSPGRRRRMSPKTRARFARLMNSPDSFGRRGVHEDLTRARIFVRARGKCAEGKPARYQMRLPGEPWPKAFVRTSDLARDMATFGLEVKWKHVPAAVQDWVLRKRGAERPSCATLRARSDAAFRKWWDSPTVTAQRTRKRAEYLRQGLITRAQARRDGPLFVKIPRSAALNASIKTGIPKWQRRMDYVIVRI